MRALSCLGIPDLTHPLTNIHPLAISPQATVDESGGQGSNSGQSGGQSSNTGAMSQQPSTSTASPGI